MSGGFGGVDEVLDGHRGGAARRARARSRSTPSSSAASTTTRVLELRRALPRHRRRSCASSNTWTSATATTGSRELVVPSQELLARIAARWPLAPLAARLPRRGRARATPSPTAPARSASSPRSRSRSAATARARGCPRTACSTPACSPPHGHRPARRRCAPAPSDEELLRAHPRRLAARAPTATASCARSCAQRRASSTRSRCTTSAAEHGRSARTPAHAPGRAQSADMVDVGAKAVTQRVAEAEARVRLPRGRGAGAASQRPPHQQGPGVRHRDHRRRHGGQAHRTS